jgi:hypothetical protein
LNRIGDDFPGGAADADADADAVSLMLMLILMLMQAMQRRESAKCMLLLVEPSETMLATCLPPSIRSLFPLCAAAAARHTSSLSISIDLSTLASALHAPSLTPSAAACH